MPTYSGVNVHLAYNKHSSVLIVSLNVKALVGTFNQEKALVGAFSVIVKLRRSIVCSTSRYPVHKDSQVPRVAPAPVHSGGVV